MLKYLSLFSGIGAFESALTNLGVNYEIVNYCEIDKYASKSYSAIHGVPETKNLWDFQMKNLKGQKMCQHQTHNFTSRQVTV